jgi:hypothetical protein
MLYIGGDWENATIAIYDVTGQQVAIHHLPLGVHAIDIVALRNGIYFAHISDVNGNYQTKFCKQE